MSSVYASTSPAWFQHLAGLEERPRRVAFWRPSNVRARQIGQGEAWYFKEWGAPQLLGYGRYERYEVTTPERLWGTFGTASGSRSLEDLITAIADARRKPTQGSTEIGNVVLTDFTPFPRPVLLAAVGLEDLPVPFRYVPEDSRVHALLSKLMDAGADLRSLERLPAEQLQKVAAEHIWNAIERLRAGETRHAFGDSTDFDLICDDGVRLPPKAVFGLAATEALGIEVLPRHFSAGIGTPCFRLLEAAGYKIVPKNENPAAADDGEASLDLEWEEGEKRLRVHFRSERRRGLARAKKAAFLRQHGRLFCERCGFNPTDAYPPEVADACIEVHHHAVRVADMSPGHRSRLEHLQCLCANCHRVTHRELRCSALSEG